MNVNMKFDRFKQWAGERMGGEIKTNVSDDFKSMEVEMDLRQQGKKDLTPSSFQMLTTYRAGQDAEVDHCLYQGYFQTIGG